MRSLQDLQKNQPQPWLSSDRSLLVMLVLLLIAAAIHSTSLLHQLPLRFNPDEPNIWRYVNHIRTTGTFFNFYPPLRLLDLSWQFLILDIISGGSSTQQAQFIFGRISTFYYTIVLLAVVYRAGATLYGRSAGIAAVVFLMAQPQVVSLTKVFKVDNFAWVMGMLTLAITFSAVRSGDRKLLLVAFIAGLAGGLAKYTMSVVLLVPGLVLILWAPRRDWLRWSLVGVAVLGFVVTVGLLISPPPPLEVFLTGERHFAQLYERDAMFQLVSATKGWAGLLEQVEPYNLLGVALVVPAASVIAPRLALRRDEWLLFGVLFATAVVAFILQSLFQTNRPQDRFLIVLIFALLWGVAISMIARRTDWLTAVAAFILVLPWILGAIDSNRSLVRPDTRALTVEWFNENVPAGTKGAIEVDFVEFDRAYGGYDGEQTYFIEDIESIYDRSLEEFARIGTEYLVADGRSSNRGGYFDTGVDNSAFLDEAEVMLDLSEPWNEGQRGPARVIFRIPSIQQNSMHVFMGGAPTEAPIIFKGYDLASTTVEAGETVDLTLYWQMQYETDANYIVFAHVVNEQGELVAQRDSIPNDGLRSTFEWQVGYFDWDEWPVQLPDDLPTGNYQLRVGMYDADTLIRLQTVESFGEPIGDAIEIATLIVE